MEITIDQLLRGKATRIKDKEYFTTEQYVTPFLERMAKFTDDFIIQAKPADQISLTPNGDVNFEDIIYNRVNIEAVLPDEYCFEGHKQVVGFVYALDTRKPVVKEYMGGLRTACLNLCTFNPSALYVQELDQRKKKLCKENNIHLIYYVPSIFSKYMDNDDIYFFLFL